MKKLNPKPKVPVLKPAEITAVQEKAKTTSCPIETGMVNADLLNEIKRQSEKIEDLWILGVVEVIQNDAYYCVVSLVQDKWVVWTAICTKSIDPVEAESLFADGLEGNLFDYTKDGGTLCIVNEFDSMDGAIEAASKSNHFWFAG